MNASKKSSYIIRLFLIGAFFAYAANAQVVPTNLWKPNYASSTIAPINSSLQIPCANIVGGCSGGVGTSTNNTFTGTNSFSGGPIIAAATSTGDYVTYLESLCPSNASGSLIFIPLVNAVSPNMLLENTRCLYEGIGGGGTTLNYSGPQGGAALQLAFAPTPHTQGGGVEDITFNNLGSATTTNPTIAILDGSSTQAGGAHSIIEGNTFIGFGLGISVTSGTYDQVIDQNVFRGNGQCIIFQHANNSGESLHLTNNWCSDPAFNNPLKQIYVAQGAVDQLDMENNTEDNAQFEMADGNTVNMIGNKNENAGSTYGSYVPILEDSSTISMLNISGEKVFNDGTSTSTSFSAVYNLGSNAYIVGTVVQVASNASSVPLLVTNAAGTGTADWTISGTQNNNNNTAFTQFGVNTPGLLATATTSILWVHQNGNGWLSAETISNSNVIQYWYGGGVYSTVDAFNGNTNGVFTGFGGTGAPSSTVDDYGSFGRAVITYNATTTIVKSGVTQGSVYVGLNTATTSIFLPVATTTQNRDIVIEANTSSTQVFSFNAGSSTDCFHLMDTVGNTTSGIVLTPSSGSSTVELIDTGSTCGALSTGDIWEEINKD